MSTLKSAILPISQHTRTGELRGDLHQPRSPSRRIYHYTLFWFLTAVPIVGSLLAVSPGGTRSSPPPTNLIDSALVAWYPFDGDARDASGNGNHGSVRGLRPVVDRSGSPSSALCFTTAQDIVMFPPSSDFSFSDYHAVTLSVWFCPGPRMRNRGFSLGLGGAGTICRHFGMSLGVAEMTAYSVAFASECIVKVENPLRSEDGPWHHILATADDQVLVLYVDGVHVGMRFVYDMKWETPMMENVLLAGYTSAYPPEGIVVDDLRIYRRVLSAGEVLALHREGPK